MRFLTGNTGCVGSLAIFWHWRKGACIASLDNGQPFLHLFSANCLGVHPLFSAIGGHCRRMVCIASYPTVAIQVIFLPVVAGGGWWRNSERTHWLPFVPLLPLLHYRFLMAWMGCVYVLIPHRVFLPYFPLFPPFESFICSHILFLLPLPFFFFLFG